MADPTEEQKKKEEEERIKAEQAAKAAQSGGEKSPSAAVIAKAIEGLTFRTNKSLPVVDDSTGKPIVENGKPKVRYVPDIRPMTKADVLSARYDGNELVLVAKDGSKHRIAK